MKKRTWLTMSEEVFMLNKPNTYIIGFNMFKTTQLLFILLFAVHIPLIIYHVLVNTSIDATQQIAFHSVHELQMAITLLMFSFEGLCVMCFFSYCVSICICIMNHRDNLPIIRIGSSIVMIGSFHYVISHVFSPEPLIRITQYYPTTYIVLGACIVASIGLQAFMQYKLNTMDIPITYKRSGWMQYNNMTNS